MLECMFYLNSGHRDGMWHHKCEKLWLKDEPNNSKKSNFIIHRKEHGASHFILTLETVFESI